MAERLKWTKTGRDERGWQADGANGRRYQIEMRKGFLLLPTVGNMKLKTYDTLAEAQSFANAFETYFANADRLARKGSAA
jgi:hypothetical protein